MSERVVLVTGGAGNLGMAVCRAFLERGDAVMVPLYHTEAAQALDPLRAEFGDRVLGSSLDLTTERGSAEAVRQAFEWRGRLDAVAHLVGGYLGGQRLGELPVDRWDAMIELNLKSAFLVARAALPRFVEAGGGSLVFVGSRAARVGRASHAAYAIAKAAVITLAESIAEEYRADGVRANVVLPGTIDTPANRSAMPDADHSAWTPPAEIAAAIAFLCSPAAAAVNGAAMPVYGRS